MVTVICLCYNHRRFVKEAIDSVIAQTYRNIEIIVVDDASTDGSAETIKQVLLPYPEIVFIEINRNRGNCAAFNKGLARASGKYIIDLAADDVMHSERVASQVRFFEQLTPDFGVIFSNAEYIGEDGSRITYHFEKDKKGNIKQSIPEGDIYAELLGTYFISPPTMMMRKAVLDDLEGYDEDLAYEDFDFWVRSSRKYLYAYQDECLTKVRLLETSHSSSFYAVGDKKLLSTYAVCQKARALNQSEKDKAALVKRIRYEIRHAVFSENFREANLFFQLLRKEDGWNALYGLLYWMNSRKLPLAGIRRFYYRVRYAGS